MKKGTRIVLIAAAALMAIGLIVGAVGHFALGGGRAEALSTEERTVSIAEAFSSLSIDCMSARVRLLPSEDGSCRVDFSESERVSTHVEARNGELRIEQKQKSWLSFSFFSFGSFDYYVDVYLPKSEYETLDIETMSGSISAAKELSFRNVKLETLSGSITLDSAVSGSAELDSKSGSISAGGFDCERIIVECTSGRISIYDISCSEAKIGCVSGRIELARLAASEKLRASNVSGSIHFEDCDGGEVHFEAVSGSIRGSLLSGKRFHTSTVTGRVRVPESTEGGSCTLETVSGGIEVTISK